MPAVFVHGVPDTPVMWSRVIAAIERDDIVLPRLPGFGVPVPDGFTSTKEEYAAWLVGQLEAIGEPVDLVGHDWGAILTQRVASTRPDLVRTLACGSGPVDVSYTWHPMAQIWQTEGAGEEMLLGSVGLPDEAKAGLLAAGGVPEDLAARQAPAMDERMARAILALYRSAIDLGADWQPAVDAMEPLPALVVWGHDDPFVAPRFGERAAQRLHAELVMFEPCGHWWPWERAEETAAALTRLWA